jgi:hypothetical protein
VLLASLSLSTGYQAAVGPPPEDKGEEEEVAG